MKGILFSTDMVRAILDGRKSVTRRVVRLPHCGYFEHDPPRGVIPPYRPGDILYVRETFSMELDRYIYKADGALLHDGMCWHPSIHMPKEASRLFLRVTGVRVERLQDIDDEGVVAEGLKIGDPFDELWDSTIKKSDLPRYGWAADPWVWIIEFERIGKEEVL